MILVRERYTPLGEESIRYLEAEEWEGRAVYDLIPEEVRNSNATVQVVRNGVDLRDEDLHEPLSDEDHLTVRLVPQHAAVAWVFFTIIIPAIIGVAVGYAVNAIINLIVGKPRRPRTGEISPTYDFETPQNTTANGTPISVVYGQVRVAGQILQAKTKVFREDAVNKMSVSLLIGLGEGGEAGYESICGHTTDFDTDTSPSNLEINGNPSNTYREVALSVRMGGKHQGIIPSFEDTVLKINTFESVVTYGVAPISVTTDNFVDTVEVKFNLPNGLFITNKQGQLLFHTVPMTIRWKPLGAAVWSNAIYFVIHGTNRGPFSVSRRITKLHQSRIQIEIERLLPETSTFNFAYDGTLAIPGPDGGFGKYVSLEEFLTFVKDTGGAFTTPVIEHTQQSKVVLVEVSEIINDDLAYVGKALGAVTAVATDQLHGSQPNVTFKTKGLKVRVFTDATTYVRQWSQNPSWAILDLLTNSNYGLGDQMTDAQVSIPDFIAFAAYCDTLVDDGKGGLEPRCQVDLVIDQTKDAWDWIYEMSLTCQAILFTSGGRIHIKADTTMSPVMMFNPGNMSSFNAGYSPPKSRINYVEVSYFDRDLNYRREMVVELDPNVQSIASYVKESIELVGVTRRSQAHRIGVYRINANKLSIRYARWTADVAAVRCEPGDVVEVAHDSVQWGLYSGLVVDAVAGSITLDREVVIEAGKSYQVRVFHTGGTFDTLAVSSPTGTYTQVAVSGSWTTTPVQYRPYTLGEVGLVTRQFKVVEMTLKADFTVELTGLEYNSLIYSDAIISQPATPTNLGVDPRQAPPDVTDLKVVQRQEVLPDGSLELVLDVSWNPPVSAIYASASVWVRDVRAGRVNSTGVVEVVWPDTPAVPKASGGYARVTGNFIIGQTIAVTVTPESIWGISKSPNNTLSVQTTFSVASQIPGDVTAFNVSRHADVLKFMWDPVSDFGAIFYEIRQAGVGLNWDAAAVLVSGISATNFETSIFFAQNTTYTATFLVKAINAAGIYSNAAASVSLSIDPRLNHNVVEFQDYRVSDWPLGIRFDLILGVGSAGARNMELSPGVSNLHTGLLVPAQEAFGDTPWFGPGGIFVGQGKGVVKAGGSDGSVLALEPGFSTFTQVHQQVLGVYESPVIDLGASLRVLTSAYIQASQFNPSLTWGNDTFSWGDPAVAAETWAGTVGESHLTATVQWRSGTSSPLLGAYATLAPTDSMYRYAQFRAVLELTDPNFDGSLEEFKVLLDVPDVIDSGEGTTDGSGILNVAFVKTYYKAASISRSVTVKAIPQGGFFLVDNESTSGFRVTVKDSGGTGIASKVVDWLAKGY